MYSQKTIDFECGHTAVGNAYGIEVDKVEIEKPVVKCVDEGRNGKPHASAPLRRKGLDLAHHVRGAPIQHGDIRNTP
jgi:hypothetical protein